MKTFHTSPRAPRSAPDSAFTMIEIAMALAIIGFALVAIIGILPQGINVQKANRQETLINQDANYWMEAIRGGAQGLDDLTNYVAAITISYGTTTNVYKNPNPNFSEFPLPSPLGNVQALQLTTGSNIVGLLSTPEYVPLAGGVFRSNYVVAYVRAMSGEAFEKAPQDNPTELGAAFAYKIIPQIVPYGSTPNTYYDSSWTNYLDSSVIGTGNSNAVASAVNEWVTALQARTNGQADAFFYLALNGANPNIVNSNAFDTRANFWLVAKNMNTNFYDVRLLFRWPVLPGGQIGNGRQVYRATVGGYLLRTNALYFFQPQIFTTNAP